MNWSIISLPRFIMLIGVIFISIYSISCKSGVTVEKVEDAIKAKLPIGSSKEEVLKFIETTSFESLKFETPFQVPANEIREATPDVGNKSKECIGAWIPNVEKGLFTVRSISVAFCFDENQKFIDYKVRKLSGV
jgi:hypothetical protein